MNIENNRFALSVQLVNPTLILSGQWQAFREQ